MGNEMVEAGAYRGVPVHMKGNSSFLKQITKLLMLLEMHFSLEVLK
jgi:hypothetical protein